MILESSQFLLSEHFLASADVDRTTVMQCQNAELAPSETGCLAPTAAPKAAPDFGERGEVGC